MSFGLGRHLDPLNQGADIANGSMLAVVWNGDPYNMSVEKRAKPAVINGTDAIVKVTTAAVCGSDLHVYHGLYGSSTPGWTMGHEAVGYIESVGPDVHYHSPGDYVIVSDNFGTGHYPNMIPVAAMNPGYGTEYTYGEHVGGCQGTLNEPEKEIWKSDQKTDSVLAEYVRVPFADDSLYPVPKTADGTWNTSLENDYVMTSDIFATGWQGLTWSGFQAGESVVVFGAGPVGQMAAYSAILRGASKVYSVDRIPERLQLAESIGAIPINFNNGSGSAQEQLQALEPRGVNRAVEAVGFEARAADGSYASDLVLQQAIEVTGTYGGVGGVGIYDVRANSTGRPRTAQLNPLMPLDTSALFSKGTQFHIGYVDARQLAPQLINLISRGKATPSYIVSAQINITDIPEYYRRFSNWEETKVLIKF